MSGTSAGGIKIAAKLKERFGADYYSRLGQKGGSSRITKFGFQDDPELARRAAQRSAEVRTAKAKARATNNKADDGHKGSGEA